MWKAKLQGVSKTDVSWSKILGERLFFNISFPSNPTFGSKKHWLLAIDDSSDYAMSFFLKKKSNLVGVMLGLIEHLKNKYNLQVQYLHYDKADENIAIKKAYKQKGLEVEFKYMAPDMPQQNGCTEQKFAILFNRVNAMLNGGKISAFLWNNLWAVAVNTATLLKNNL